MFIINGQRAGFSRANSMSWRQRLLITGPVSAGLTAYQGQIGTRTVVCDQKNISNPTMRGIRYFYVPKTISNPSFTFPNWYVDGFNAARSYFELGTGAAATIRFALQNQAGTILGQGLFSGSASGTISDLSELTSDPIPVTLTPGWYATRYWWSHPSAVIFLGGAASGTNIGQNRLLGDNFDVGAAVIDNTLGGTYTATSGTSGYGPTRITALTTAASVLVLGNSLSYGEHDTGDLTGDVGYLPRILGTNGLNMPYASYGVGGDSANTFNTHSALRRAAIPFFSHVISGYGVNSFIIWNNNAAQIRTLTNANYTLLAASGKPVFCVTMTPAATSTDNYATTVNQTPPAYGADRVTENTARRANVDGWNGVIDLASVLESSLNSNLWVPALGYVNNTSSVHPVKPGYDAPRAANLVPPGTFS